MEFEHIMILAVALLAIFTCVMLVIVNVNVANKGLAQSAASNVSSDLGYEVGAAQRLSNEEAERVALLALANKNNKAGQAELNASAGQMNLANAQATKVIEESHTIRDDRDSKKIGYGGIAGRELLQEFGGLPGVVTSGACVMLVLIGIGFVGAVVLLSRVNPYRE